MENLKKQPLNTGYTRIHDNMCRHQAHDQLGLSVKHTNQQHRLAYYLCISLVVLLSLSMVYLYTEYSRLRCELDFQKQVLSSIIQGGKLNSSQTKMDQFGGNNFSSNKSLLTKLFLHQNNSAVEMILNKPEVTHTLSYSIKQSNAVLNRNRRDDGGNRRNRNNRPNNNENVEEVTRKPQRNKQKQVIHLVIDKQHEHLSLENPDIKTGSRGEPIRYWKFSDTGFNYEQSFANLNEPEGSITILESGVYFIYSQMTYFDRSGRWSHLVSINDRPFIKCMASEWGIDINPETNVHYNTIHQCYTAAVAHISANSKVTISGMYPDRIIHPDKEMSFWGILKLA